LLFVRSIASRNNKVISYNLYHSDKAKAFSMLSKIEIQKQRQAKTGTADVPENLTTNLTENYVKIPQNTARYVKPKELPKEEKENVTPCKTKTLQKVTAIRPKGLEPLTYGLEKCFHLL